MFVIAEPFRVRVPNPYRHKAGEMEPATVAFDGATVHVAFHKAAQSLGWWCGAAIHEYQWLQEVRTAADAATHFADRLAAEYDTLLTGDQRGQLRSAAEVVPAGNGLAVYLSADMAGVYIPGGPNWIYVLSARGSRGALRVPDSTYHSYPVDRFEVLDGAAE